jgi:hypothetical protein
MSKDGAIPIIGIDVSPLPVLPPERDERAWAKLVRVMFYTPVFLAMLLLDSGEPEAFGITEKRLMPVTRRWGISVVPSDPTGNSATCRGLTALNKLGSDTCNTGSRRRIGDVFLLQ